MFENSIKIGQIENGKTADGGRGKREREREGKDLATRSLPLC